MSRLRPLSSEDLAVRDALLARRKEILAALCAEGWVIAGESDYSTHYQVNMRIRLRLPGSDPYIDVCLAVAIPPTDPYQAQVLSEVRLTETTPIFP